MSTPLTFSVFDILNLLSNEAVRAHKLGEFVTDVAIWSIYAYQHVPEEDMIPCIHPQSDALARIRHVANGFGFDIVPLEDE